MKKFRKLKIDMGSFNTFYCKFINLAVKLKFVKEMLLQEFMHKLSPCIQNRMNSKLEYPDNIKDKVMYYQKIYNQIIVIYQVQLNIKLANTKVANTPTRFGLPLFQTTSISTSAYCPSLENIFSLFTNKKHLELMKKKSYFIC